jgi:hypothetical protein
MLLGITAHAHSLDLDGALEVTVQCHDLIKAKVVLCNEKSK